MRVCSPGFKAYAARGQLEWHGGGSEYAFSQGVCAEVIACHPNSLRAEVGLENSNLTARFLNSLTSLGVLVWLKLAS